MSRISILKEILFSCLRYCHIYLWRRSRKGSPTLATWSLTVSRPSQLAKFSFWHLSYCFLSSKPPQRSEMGVVLTTSEDNTIQFHINQNQCLNPFVISWRPTDKQCYAGLGLEFSDAQFFHLLIGCPRMHVHSTMKCSGSIKPWTLGSDP